jgi:hypothetical protein
MPLVVQLNKRDLPDALPRDEMEAILNPDRVPSFESVASKSIGVKETLKGIAALVLRRLSEITESAPSAASSLERKAAAAASEQQVIRSQKVSLAAGAAEQRMPAKESAVAAAAGPTPQPSVAEALPPKPARAAEPAVTPTRTSVETPDIHLLQKCDLLWRGLRVGTGTVEISRRVGVDRKISYLLTCQTTCFQLFRRVWKCMLQWSAEEKKVVDYHTVSFYIFTNVAPDSKPFGDIRVWVKNAFDKGCYAAFRGFAGEVRLTPAGHAWFE